MNRIKIVLAMSAALSVFSSSGVLLAQVRDLNSRRVEPGAGKWRTWMIPSGQAYRVPPPPDSAATRGELQWLKEAAATVTDTGMQQVKHWDAGPPVYRWMEMLERRVTGGETITAHPHRVLAYVSIAMYDATIAT